MLLKLCTLALLIRKKARRSITLPSINMASETEDYVMISAADVHGFNDKQLLPLPTEEISKIQEWIAPTDYRAESSERRKNFASHLPAPVPGYWKPSNTRNGTTPIKVLCGSKELLELKVGYCCIAEHEARAGKCSCSVLLLSTYRFRKPETAISSS